MMPVFGLWFMSQGLGIKCFTILKVTWNRFNSSPAAKKFHCRSILGLDIDSGEKLVCCFIFFDEKKVAN